MGFLFQDKRPTNATNGYDFRETSAASHDIVVQKVKKIDFGNDKDFTGAHYTPTTRPDFAFAMLNRQLRLPTLHFYQLPALQHLL